MLRFFISQRPNPKRQKLIKGKAIVLLALCLCSCNTIVPWDHLSSPQTGEVEASISGYWAVTGSRRPRYRRCPVSLCQGETASDVKTDPAAGTTPTTMQVSASARSSAAARRLARGCSLWDSRAQSFPVGFLPCQLSQGVARPTTKGSVNVTGPR